MALLLIGVGLLGPVSLGVWREKNPAGLQTDDDDKKLDRELDARVRADRSRRRRRLAWIGWASLLAGIGILLGSYLHDQSVILSFINSNGGGSKGGQPPPILLPPAPPPATGVPLALIIGNIALIAIGAVLLLIGRGRIAKGAGVAAIAGGLIGHGYLVKDFKIDKIFGFDKFLSFGDPKLDFEIRKDISEYSASSKLEHVGAFPRFLLGSADLKQSDFDWQAEIHRECAVWRTHTSHGEEGVLLIVGATDRLPLHGGVANQYEANVGLAQARAEEVKRQLLSCINAPESHPIDPLQVLTLASGPATTPTGKSAGSATKGGFPNDRRVDVWAFWVSNKSK